MITYNYKAWSNSVVYYKFDFNKIFTHVSGYVNLLLILILFYTKYIKKNLLLEGQPEKKKTNNYIQ